MKSKSAGPGPAPSALGLSALALPAQALSALVLCALALLAGCVTGGSGAIPPGLSPALSPGLSAEEKDAITRADRACDQASTGAAIDPSSHCYVRRRSP